MDEVLHMYDLGVPVVITRDNDSTLNNSERLLTMTDTFENNENVIVLSSYINADVAEFSYQ